MNGEKINNSANKLRILIAPLDWGLGHATRCIPIIQYLLKHNTEVLLAAKGNIKCLLEKEFPGVQILDLEGYKISYARRRNLFLLKLVTQLPRVYSAIRSERKWLAKIIRDERIDAVISDNRPGLYHADVPCVYITHQLQIQTGYRITDNILRRLHYKFIHKFQECWIPDNHTEHILAGKLSHPVLLPSVPCKYLGLLSRFQKKNLPVLYDYLWLLSGPEPQRSMLEKKLLQAFKKETCSIAVVRGLPSGDSSLNAIPANAKVFNHLAAAALNDIILQSNIVIARAGYSSVMDLATLQKKAVLIPTPGQTEQEYLAVYLNGKSLFTSIRQEDITLDAVERAYKKQTDKFPENHVALAECIVGDWLTMLSQRASAI